MNKLFLIAICCIVLIGCKKYDVDEYDYLTRWSQVAIFVNTRADTVIVYFSSVPQSYGSLMYSKDTVRHMESESRHAFGREFNVYSYSNNEVLLSGILEPKIYIIN